VHFCFATVSSPAEGRSYLRVTLAKRDHEVFVVLFMDAQNRVIASEEMFRGTLTQTSVYPREVVKRALAHNAGAVILVHFVARYKMGLLCHEWFCAPVDRVH